MEADRLQEIANAQKEALEQLRAFMTQNGDQMVKMGGEVKAASELMGTIEKRVKAIEDAIRTRAGGVLPGLEDEVNKNGAVNIMDMLFKPNSRSRSLANEYGRKKRALLDQDPDLVPEGQGRDMSTSTDSQGGYLVSTQMLPGYIPKARARSVVWKEAGLTILDNLNGMPIEIPVETGDPTVVPVSETEAPTASDVTVGQLVFYPHVLRALTKLSQRLIRLGPLAEQIVRRAHERMFALEMDRIILRGSGTSKEALGIANTGGINTVAIGTNGGPFTFSIAANMAITVEEADLGLTGQNLKYISHPRAFWKMRTERIPQFSGDLAGAYVILPMNDETMKASLGYDFLKTTRIPKNLTKGSGTNLTEVYYGDWEEGWLALWEDMTFKVSDVAGDATGSAFTQSQLWIQAELEYDFQLAHAAAFCLVNDATTT